MFDTDHQIKAQALRVWANCIETGTPSMSVADLKARMAADPKYKAEVSVLTSEQINLVSRIRLLAAQEITEDGRSFMHNNQSTVSKVSTCPSERKKSFKRPSL